MKRFYRKQGSEEEFREQGTGQRERFDNPELEQNIFEQSQKQGFEEPLDKKQQALQIAVKKVREFREKEKRLPRKDEYEQIHFQPAAKTRSARNPRTKTRTGKAGGNRKNPAHKGSKGCRKAETTFECRRAGICAACSGKRNRH